MIELADPSEAAVDAAQAWVDTLTPEALTDALAVIVAEQRTDEESTARLMVGAQILTIVELIGAGLDVDSAMDVVLRPGAISAGLADDGSLSLSIQWAVADQGDGEDQ